VIVHFTVLETPEKKSLENAGGLEMLAKWNGDKAGLPFLAILDPSGKLLINSNRLQEGKDQRSNTGHPAAKEEVDHFMVMLKKTAPRMTAEDLKSVEEFLRSQKIG